MTSTLEPRQADPGAVDEASARLRLGARLRRSAERQPAVSALVLSLVVLLMLYGAALLVIRPSSSGRQVSLDEVITLAGDGRVERVRFLDQDARVVGTIGEGEGAGAFWTAYPRSDAATNDLVRTFLASDTVVTVDAQSGKAVVRFLAQFLLPLVILANLFALLFSLVRTGGEGGGEFLNFSRIGNRQVGEGDRTGTTFADIAGAPEVVAEVAEVRDYLANPDAFRRMGALPPKGVLLVGPPGCGKTLLARAVAGEARASFFSISGSEFVESLVGVGAARVRDLFAQARAAAPTILFIDELDAVGRQRGAGLGGGHDEREQTLNELLVQMDGFSPTEGVAVLAATNRLDILDPALLRAGRFDRHITMDRPDLAGRLEILRLHGSRKRLANPEADLPDIARHTPGFTGADLASVLNEGALLAVRDRSPAIDAGHLQEAVERVLSGPKRRRALLSPDDQRRIAVHEAGHAVVAASMGKAGEIQKVSIISRGRGVGHLAMVGSDSVLPTRADMEAQVIIAMAGVAAEELLLGQTSTGAEADLERATGIARDMAGRFGMSTRLGRVRILHEQREVFLGRDYLYTRDVSQPTLEHLDLEVRTILDDQEAAAKAILIAHRHVLESLATALVAKETIQGPELAQGLATVRAYRDRSPSARPASGNAATAGQSAG